MTAESSAMVAPGEGVVVVQGSVGVVRKISAATGERSRWWSTRRNLWRWLRRRTRTRASRLRQDRGDGRHVRHDFPHGADAPQGGFSIFFHHASLGCR